MNRLLVPLFTVALACAFTSGCGEQGGERIGKEDQRGKIDLPADGDAGSSSILDAATYDFGAVTFGSSATREIIVRNSGTGSLHLASLEKASGAPVKIGESSSDPGAVFDVGFAPRDLGPGELVKFTVTFTPPAAEAPNEFTATLLLSTDDPEQKATIILLGLGAPGVCASSAGSDGGVDPQLTWSPTAIDCGYATPGVEVDREITFENHGLTDVVVSNFAVTNSNESFLVPPTMTSLTVPGCGTATLTVACKPSVLGPRQAELKFETTVASQPEGAITLRWFGGGPDLEVSPSPILNFGKVAYFANANPPTFATRKLRVMNVGTAPSVADPKANLRFGQDDGSGNFGPPYFEVTPLNADTRADEFTVTMPSTYDPAVGLQVKVGLNIADLVVTFTPTSIGSKAALLKIFSNDPDEPVVQITLSANAVVLPPCNYSVTPPTLDFGALTPLSHQDLSFSIRNEGTTTSDVCIVIGVDLAPNSDLAFSLPDGPMDNYELGPGETRNVLVRASAQGQAPTSPLTLTGQINFSISSDTQPFATVPLTAQIEP